MKILCFDIGGTAIKYALYQDDKRNEIQVIKTNKDNYRNWILEDVMKKIEEYEGLDAVAISTAGVVDNIKGEIVFAGPTIPGYTGTKIKKSIEEKFGIPCFVENDVNAAAYGEYVYSKLTGSIFCMTVGTGLGGGFILNGEIFTGNSMTAGEIGYMPFKGGYLQDFASSTYLCRYATKKMGRKLDGKEIFEEGKRGNKLAKEAIDTLITNLCHGILNVIYTVNPKTIVIGGGITAQGDYLENLILNKLDNMIISNQFKTEIKLAKLQNGAGLYGMYSIARKELK